jgi:hypothetical protein
MFYCFVETIEAIAPGHRLAKCGWTQDPLPKRQRKLEYLWNTSLELVYAFVIPSISVERRFHRDLDNVHFPLWRKGKRRVEWFDARDLLAALKKRYLK